MKFVKILVVTGALSAFVCVDARADVRTNGQDVAVSGVCTVRGLVLTSGQRLRIAEGAELSLTDGAYVTVSNATGVTITGRGIIRGGGIRIVDSRRVRIDGLSFEESSAVAEVSGTSSDIAIVDCRGLDVYRGLWIRGVRRGGGEIRRITVDGLRLRGQTEYVLHLNYAAGSLAEVPRPTHIEDISLSGISNEKSVYGFAVNGCPADPVRGLRLADVRLGNVRWRDFELGGVEDIAYDGVPGICGTLLRHGSHVLNYSFYDEVFRRVVAADRAADAVWLACDTAEKVKAHQRGLRDRAVAAMGGFPARCPLNPVVSGRIEKDGYSIEKVLFESRPGFHVSAHLFLPDRAKFPAPHPALLVPCGHDSMDAKWGAGYQRAGVFGARQGFAVLVYDPIDQGERRQKRDGAKSWSSTAEHNDVGVRAMLVGSSQAAIRLYDGIRALDYLETRSDIDRTRLGVLGMSGGGTLSANINAFDDRIRCGAPAGFLSTMRDVYDNCGPQDAEQQFFGELALGFNHLGFVCLRAPSPTLITVSHNDFFPLMGAMATRDRAKAVYAVAGNADAVELQETSGPHHWYQSNQKASLGWMRRWLNGRADAWTAAAGRELRFGDAGFAVDADNAGSYYDPEETRWCAPNGGVLNLKGERSIYEILREELSEARAKAPAVSPAVVRKVSGIRPVGEIAAVVCPNSRRSAKAGNLTATSFVVQRKDDMVMLPVIVVTPNAKSELPPVLFVSDAKRRYENSAAIRRYLGEGRAVAVADLRGFGETAAGKHSFYGSPDADEETAVMLYALGDSLVARRAEDVGVLAGVLSEELGGRPLLHAVGRAAIPAAHARYLDPAAFAGVVVENEPLSWSEVLADETKRYPFSNCIQGALRHYDWKDLLK